VAVMVYAHGIYGAGLDVCCLLLGLTVTKSCCNDWFERFRVLFCNNCSISRPLHHYHDADHAVSCRLFVTKIGDVCRKFYRPFVNAFHLSWVLSRLIRGDSLPTVCGIVSENVT